MGELFYGEIYLDDVKFGKVKEFDLIPCEEDKWTSIDELLFSEVNTSSYLPEIKDVIINDPAVIVLFSDGSKTVVKANDRYGDEFDPEKGLAMALVKRVYGNNKGNFNNIFRKWIWEREDV